MLLDILADVERKVERQRAGAVLHGMINSAKKAKERFNKTSGEIMRYCYADDYNFEYQSLPTDSFFLAKVAKTAEALQVFGPELYAQNPHRQTSPKEFASDRAIERSEVMYKYLNYTPNECDLRSHGRYATDESISCGAGVLWTGMDPKKKLVTSRHDSIDNLLLDPDALHYDEMNFVVRERVRPKWECLEEYGQWAKAINALDACKQRKSNSGKVGYWQGTDQGAECVRYYEVYMKVGLHRYKDGKELAQAVALYSNGQEEVDDMPLKYLVGDNGEFIGVTPWEVPFFLDNEFPCTILDYFRESNSIWPVSPLKNGLGFQKAMNWIVTLMMGKYKFTSRTTLAILSQNGNEIDDSELFKVLHGNEVEAIKIKANGDQVSLKDFLQQFEWNHDYLHQGRLLLSEMEMQFEKSTGLYSVLYTGEGQRQSRSAKDAEIKSERSSSRINDMRDNMDAFQSKVARKEAMAARFLHTREDITGIFGRTYGDQWGTLIKPDEDIKMRFYEQAIQAGMEYEQAEMMVNELIENATSLEKWLYECDYHIEAGSTRRRNEQQLIDGLSEMMNQFVPAVMQSPDPMERSAGYTIVIEYFKAMKGSEIVINKLEMLSQMLEQQAMQPPMLPPGAEMAPQPQ